MLHPHCEPDLADRVAALVKEFAAEDFKVRESADERLAALMPAAFSHLAKAAGRPPTPRPRPASSVCWKSTTLRVRCTSRLAEWKKETNE